MKLSEKFQEAYDSGRFDSQKDLILPFLRNNLEKLKKFIDDFEKGHGKQSLENLVKYFILSSNLPFNMQKYLQEQSEAMKNDIGPEFNNPEVRTKLAAEWIEKKAANFRNHSIMEQVYCFSRLKNDILPIITEDLKKIN